MRFLFLLLFCALTFAQSRAAPSTNSPTRLTQSQQILAKVMDDIRRCDKSVRYEYDKGTRRVSPPELRMLKGMKFKRLLKDVAIFEVNETYKDLKLSMLLIGRRDTTYTWPVHSVAFATDFETTRDSLERLWQIRFENGVRPGPIVVENGIYAYFVMNVDGKQRTLSIELMPIDIYPYIDKTMVGCNTVDR